MKSPSPIMAEEIMFLYLNFDSFNDLILGDK